MRRVVFVNRFFYPDHSATSQMLTDLAFGLSQRGRFRVTVVTSRQSYDAPQAALAVGETVGGVDIRRVWSTRFGRHRLLGRALDYLTFYLGAAATLLRTVGRGDVVVAKTDPPLVSVVAMLVCRLRGALLVNWLQDVFPEIAVELGVRGARLVAPLARILRNKSVAVARRNVVLGERMLEHMRGQVPGADLVIVPNWADGHEIRPVPPDRNPLRSAWGLDDRVVVGYSGNMGRAHEFEGLLEVAERLAGTDVVFLFIGGGARRKEIERFAEGRGLRNVMLKPYQPRNALSLSLGVADLHIVSLNAALEGLVVPSKYYGIAAAGRPVVAIGDEDGEIGRIVRRFDTGVTVPSGDVRSLERAIRDLCADTAERLRLGRNARAAFEREFSKARALDAWEGVLRSACGEVP